MKYKINKNISFIGTNFLILLIMFAVIGTKIFPDSLGYLKIGTKLFHGIPRSDLDFIREIGYPLFVGLNFSSPYLIAITQCILYLIGIYFLLKIFSSFFSPKIIMVYMVIITIYLPLKVCSFNVLRESFEFFLTCMVIYSFYRFYQSEGKRLWLIIAGISSGYLAITLKIYLLLPIILFLLFLGKLILFRKQKELLTFKHMITYISIFSFIVVSAVFLNWKDTGKMFLSSLTLGGNSFRSMSIIIYNEYGKDEFDRVISEVEIGKYIDSEEIPTNPSQLGFFIYDTNVHKQLRADAELRTIAKKLSVQYPMSFKNKMYGIYESHVVSLLPVKYKDYVSCFATNPLKYNWPFDKPISAINLLFSFTFMVAFLIGLFNSWKNRNDFMIYVFLSFIVLYEFVFFWGSERRHILPFLPAYLFFALGGMEFISRKYKSLKASINKIVSKLL